MFYIALMVAVAVSSIIETSSWNLRSQASRDNKGLFIARTNIYLYGGRFFLLAFSTGLAYLVDINATVVEISLLIFSSYMSAALAHTLLISGNISNLLVKSGARLLGLPNQKSGPQHVFHAKIFWFTSLSASFFCVAMATPFIIATQFPEYRMTLSGVGQLINSFGTLILLFMVDPLLYRLLDKNILSSAIRSYTMGRLFGFFLGGLLALIPYLIIQFSI